MEMGVNLGLVSSQFDRTGCGLAAIDCQEVVLIGGCQRVLMGSAQMRSSIW